MVNTVTDIDLMLDRMASLAITKFAAKLNFPSLVGRWTDGMEGPNPKKYLVPKIGAMAANVFSETGKVIPQNVTSGNLEVPVEMYEATFEESAMSQSSDISKTTMARMDQALDAIKRKVDERMLQLVAADVTVTQNAGAYATALNRAALLSAKLQLDKKEAEDERYLIITNQGDADLRNDADYKAMGIYNQNGVIIDGKLPRAEGFQMYTSPRVYSPGATQADGLAFTRNSIYTVFPQWTPNLLPQGKLILTSKEQDGIRIGMAIEQKEGTLGALSYTVFCRFGAKAVNPDGIVRVKHLIP